MKRNVGILFVIVVLLIVGFVRLDTVVSPHIRKVHTGFLFGQIDVVLRSNESISSMAELVQHLSGHPIDWNSCSISGNQLFDGWGEVIRFRIVGSGGFELQSSGADRTFGTVDDITRQIDPLGAARPERANDEDLPK